MGVTHMLRAAVAVAGVVTATVVVSAQPAAAHSVGGIEASNFETRVDTIAPRVEGIAVRAVDLGNELELDNETGADVVVTGYQGEPYLKVGPDGVFENRRSPATYLNRTRDGKTRVPSSADPGATPVWRKVGSGDTARWHDHRAHWMGTSDPEVVARNPGRGHVVERWQVELTQRSRTISVSGRLLWVPGPSPWGWLTGALAVALALVALSRTRLWRWAIAAALAVLVVSEIAHVVGQWTATSTSLATKATSSAYSAGGITLAAIALVWILVRPPSNAIPAVLFAGLVVTAAGGLADLTALTRSQLPTDLPAGIARLSVVLALGLGAGLAIAAALRLRPPPPPVVEHHAGAIDEPMHVR